LFGEFPVNKIISELDRDNLLPAILFRTSRRQCDDDIERLSMGRSGQISPHDQETVARAVDEIIQKYGMAPEVILKHPQYPALITTASGAHHAGQLLMWRLLLEELMTQSQLRLMVATGTVAAGVDFPARTVVITAHSKRGSEGFNILTSSEFQQMSGRAGRRGKDAVGICLIAPSLYSDARVIHEVIQRPPEPLRSAYYAAPATVLNLLKYRNVDDLRYTVSKSLASFLDHKSARIIREDAAHEEERINSEGGLSDEARKKGHKRVRRKVRDAELLENRQLELLQRSLDGLTKLGYVENSGLTEKGGWAANLCTSLVLELAEAIQDHIFDDLSEEEFVALVASIAGDPHRPYFSIKANPIKREYFQKLDQVVKRVKASYTNPNASEVEVLPDAANTVLTWMESESWVDFSGLLRLAGVAEGDVARLVTQTADHLNQISRLHESHPDLARMAEGGRMRILRPPLTEPVLND
jgi:ATP-dependent RNA helicase HelY